jgi:hypothetical protein
LTSAVLKKIFIASSTTKNDRGLQPDFALCIGNWIKINCFLIKLLDLALEFTIEKEGMLGEVMALFQDMHLEPGLQPALKLALHWGCPSPVSRTRAVLT